MAQGRTTSGRGFRGMDPDKQRAIAAKGGRASHGGRKPSNTTNKGSAPPRTNQSRGTIM